MSNTNSKVIRLLTIPQIGKTYLLNALDSGSEQVFIKALHQIIDDILSDMATNNP